VQKLSVFGFLTLIALIVIAVGFVLLALGFWFATFIVGFGLLFLAFLILSSLSGRYRYEEV